MVRQMWDSEQHHVGNGTMAKTRMGNSPFSTAVMYTCSNASHTSLLSPIDPMSHTVVTPVPQQRQKKKNKRKRGEEKRKSRREI